MQRLTRVAPPGRLGDEVDAVLDTLGVPVGAEFVVSTGKLPESARTRRTDPDTSRGAAKSIDDLRASQRAVLGFFGWQPGGKGMTDEELVNAYGSARARALRNGGMAAQYPKQSASGLRSRRAELVDAGFLMDSRERREISTGRKAIVWKLTPEHAKPPEPPKPPIDPYSPIETEQLDLVPKGLL